MILHVENSIFGKSLRQGLLWFNFIVNFIVIAEDLVEFNFRILEQKLRNLLILFCNKVQFYPPWDLFNVFVIMSQSSNILLGHWLINEDLNINVLTISSETRMNKTDVSSLTAKKEESSMNSFSSIENCINKKYDKQGLT